MILKEKANEAKVYGEIKVTLTTLINDFLLEYKKYDELYKELFIKWRDNVVEDFKLLFKEENFDIKEEQKTYSNYTSRYKKVCVTLYDLEFELSIDEEYFNIRFLQNKPADDTKNIVLRPTLEHYTMSEINMTSDIPYKQIKLRNINDLNDILKSIANAEYSINDMQELNKKLSVEMTKLLTDTNKLNTIPMKGIASNTDIHGANRDKKYGQFNHFSEFIEML